MSLNGFLEYSVELTRNFMVDLRSDMSRSKRLSVPSSNFVSAFIPCRLKCERVRINRIHQIRQPIGYATRWRHATFLRFIVGYCGKGGRAARRELPCAFVDLVFYETVLSEGNVNASYCTACGHRMANRK